MGKEGREEGKDIPFAPLRFSKKRRKKEKVARIVKEGVVWSEVKGENSRCQTVCSGLMIAGTVSGESRTDTSKNRQSMESVYTQSTTSVFDIIMSKL